MLTADEPRLTGASVKSMSLDLNLDYQFESPPASHAEDGGQSSRAAPPREAEVGLQLRVYRGGSKTASDPVRKPRRSVAVA